MKIVDWIRDFFGGKDEVTLNQRLAEQQCKLMIEDFAIQMAINLIAGVISKCEFRTLDKGMPVKGDEYYLWNVEPNVNQNSNHFLQELISKLLYNNEVLVIEINHQLIIADNFTQDEYATLPNVFRNVSRGTMQFERAFSMKDVLYFKLANENIRGLLSNLLTGYSNLLNMAVGKYKRAGGRKGVIDLNKIAVGTQKDQEQIDRLFNQSFKGYFESENAVLSLPRGATYTEITGEGSRKSTSDVVDIANITREAFERVAQAFRIPPSLLRGDIADIEKLTDNFLTFCIDPICDLIAAEINCKRFGRSNYLAGSRIKIDTTRIRHVDIFSISEHFDKLIASGGYSIDDLREKAGDEPIGARWSSIHWMTRNYQHIAVAAQEVRNESE